jgi:beta-galactosidase
MRQVQWDNQSYIIDGKPVYLVSGEFHYFRVPKQDWRTRLQLFKDAGGNCVATYVPWILHEPAEGDIRFGDTDQRDMEAFLKLCGEMSLLVVCRPGPYQYSELKYCGLPGWLCEGYPQLLAQDVHGKPINYCSVSYMHPLFLQKTKTWFDAALPLIAKYTVQNGGPVAFVQFDNELTGMHLWYGGMDYNREAMGIGNVGGRYPLFLRNRYGSIERLNQSYGTSYPSFTAVQPADPSSAKGAEGSRAVKDYQDFYLETIADYAATLSGWIRDAGIQCCLVHNSGNPGMNLLFRETVEKLKGDFVLGSDHYYNLDMNWAQNNPTPQYAMNVLVSLEELRNMGFPASVFELPSGSCSEWPPMTEGDLRCCYYTNLAFGMKGVNYYVFTGGPNPAGLGENGDSYDYNAPVGAKGEIRAAYHMMKEFGVFLRGNSWLARAERAADISVGYVTEYGRSDCYSRGAGGEVFSGSDAWTYMRKGLVITSLCASLSPALVDIETNISDAAGKPLLVAASSTMSAKAQQGLIEFVRGGGKLLLSPVIPTMDENFNPCTLLLDFLGCEPPVILGQNAPSARIGTVANVMPAGDVWRSFGHPEGAETIGMEELSGQEIAWKKSYGKGLVIWLGLHWIHRKFEHTRVMEYLALQLGVGAKAVECGNQNLWTALWSDGDKSMLFVMNLFSQPMEAEIRVRTKDESYKDLGKMELKPMEVRRIEL